MAAFWIIAVLMIGLAAVFALWPVYRGRSETRAARIRAHSNLAVFEDRLAELEADRDEGRVEEEEYQVLRLELERALLGDVAEAEADESRAVALAEGGRGLMIGSAVLVPLLALVLYADWGLGLGALEDWQIAQQFDAMEAAPGGPDREAMAALVDRLEQRLQANREDIDGWFLLGRTALNLGEFERAASAFAEVIERVPNEISPLVFKAQALYLADDRQLSERARAVTERALQVEPGQPIVLELLALDAFQAGRFTEAAGYFQQVLESGVPPGDRRQFLMEGLARSMEQAGLSPDQPPLLQAPGPQEPAVGPTPAGIRVQVAIPEDELERLPDTARLFVIARPVEGTTMPLAVERVRPRARIEVTLSDQNAMMQQGSLQDHDAVEVVARLSPQGTAERGPGDVERVAAPVSTRGDVPVSLWLGAGEPPDFEDPEAVVPIQ